MGGQLYWAFPFSKDSLQRHFSKNVAYVNEPDEQLLITYYKKYKKVSLPVFPEFFNNFYKIMF